MRRVVVVALIVVVGIVAMRLVVSRGTPTRAIDPDLSVIPLRAWFRSAPRVDVRARPLRMTVAVASLESVADKAQNLRRLATSAESIVAANPAVRLIVFGEAALGLYYHPDSGAAYQRRVAEPVPGPATDSVGALARRLHVNIAFGLMEASADTVYNTLVVVGPDGRLLAKHRKMLLHEFDERNGVRRAEPNAEVVDIDGFRVGLAICADANSKWLKERYRRAGIDLLVYSVTSDVPFIVKWRRYWPVSPDYAAWILAANRFGREGATTYPGTAFVSSPNGAIEAMWKSGPGFVVADVGVDRRSVR